MTSSGTFQKSLSAVTTPDEIADVGARGWNLLREDLSLPAALLVEPRLEHNLRWMAEFARRYGVQLAPHGKTTMVPKLFERQLEAGAWGIALATAHQCSVAHAHGVRQILMANELLGPASRELVSSIVAEGTTFYTLVDSPALVNQLGTFFSAKVSSSVCSWSSARERAAPARAPRRNCRRSSTPSPAGAARFCCAA